MAKDATEEVPESLLCSVLIEEGVKLLAPPPSDDGILSVLDTIEDILSLLWQNPSPAVWDALLPSIKGLNSDRLFKHLNVDVKVSVLSCMHELLRIAAPDAPYNDDCLKKIFQQTVESVFGKLSSLSRRSFMKALKILHNVAKFRSGLTLLGLGCDALISRMVQIFLHTIHQNHPNAVFLNMEEVMTRLIQESDELSLDILKPLITVVINKENQIISPDSRILAMKVLKNCREKLKPYLTESAEQLRRDAEDCTRVIASICPALENVVKAETDTSDLVPILVGSASTQRDNYKSSLVIENSSRTLHGHEQLEQPHIVAKDSVRTDTVETGEVFLRGREKNSMTLAGNEQINLLKKRKYILSDSGMKGKAIDPECDSEILPKRSKKPRTVKDYREEIVGSRVKVWKHELYDAVVQAYDPVKQQHKVVFLDGDEEYVYEKLNVQNCILLVDEPIQAGQEANHPYSSPAVSINAAPVKTEDAPDQ